MLSIFAARTYGSHFYVCLTLLDYTQADPAAAAAGVPETLAKMRAEPGMQLLRGVDISAILGFLLGFFGFGCNEVTPHITVYALLHLSNVLA
jgi:hypothetical protein